MMPESSLLRALQSRNCGRCGRKRCGVVEDGVYFRLSEQPLGQRIRLCEVGNYFDGGTSGRSRGQDVRET